MKNIYLLRYALFLLQQLSAQTTYERQISDHLLDNVNTFQFGNAARTQDSGVLVVATEMNKKNHQYF